MKKIFMIVFCVLVASSFLACSNNSNVNTDTIAQLEARIDELEKENEALKSAPTAAETPAPVAEIEEVESAAAPEPTPEETGTPISFDETITVDGVCEFIVKKHVFTDTIEPSSPTGYYTFYEVKDVNNTFLDVLVDFKNLKSGNQKADEAMSVEIKYDNNYSYQAPPIVEDADGSNLSYSNITAIAPLTTSKLHYAAEVPKEMVDSEKPITAFFKIGNEKYVLSIR